MPPSDPTHTRRSQIALFGLVALLFTFSVGVQLVRYLIVSEETWLLWVFITQFDLNLEYNIPTWIASLLFAYAALTQWRLALSAPGWPHRHLWGVLAALCLLASLDEYIQIHERLGNLLPSDAATAITQQIGYAWVIPGLVIALAVLILGAYAARWLPHPARVWMGLGLILFLIGALGLETLGGAYYSRTGDYSLPFYLIANTEELFEFLGLALYVNGLWLVPPPVEIAIG